MTRKLIYILGAGRSGTTLLDIMLGNNSNAVSLGEINRFYKRSGQPPHRDSDSSTYKFWTIIKSNLKDKGHSNLSELNSLFQKNEYHTSFLKTIFKINNHKYRNCLNDMYIAINEKSNKEVIIESSKYPCRALNISNYVKNKDLSIHYIYLKKDPVSVVSSFQKADIEQPKKGFLSANLYYFFVNILCSVILFIIKLKGHNTKIIKYEDLVANPVEVLVDLQYHFKIDQQELINKIENNTPLETGLLFDGNRIRLEDSIILRNQSKTINKNFKYYFTRTLNYILYN